MKNLIYKKLFKEACYINGSWMPTHENAHIAVNNPFDGTTIGYVPKFTQAETRVAINAAHAAQPAWKALTPKERSGKLLAWAALIDQHADDLATIMTMEQGKPLAESKSEIDYANSFIKWFANEGLRAYGDIIASNKPHQRLLVLKEPIGVVAAITPWNFPAAMITRKIAPALAVGCTVVVKPDSATPFSALALAVLAEEAQIPAGVLNVVTGDAKSIGEEMTANSLVRKLSFTGSTNVGRLLMAQCAPTVKKISLELGGNAPFIVFEDADIEAAVQGAMASKFRNSGQTCVCVNRFYVHAHIHDEFVAKFTTEIKKLKLGNGLDSTVQQGPLINKKAVEKVNAHIADALNKGARTMCGGNVAPVGQLFYEPTLLINANSSMLLAKEETFGPVAAVFKFSDEAEVIQLANATEFGLSAYFYSQNNARIWRVAAALEAGMVGVNTGIISTEIAPFGGIKQSGMGREGSKYGLDDYLQTKYICLND